MRTPDPKRAPPPETDSVLELHRQHMAEMNDASMTVDGTPPDEERDTVQGMLDVLWREHAEPRDGFEPVPFWVAVIFGGLLAWGGDYIGSYTPRFPPGGVDPAHPKGLAPPAPAAAGPQPKTGGGPQPVGGAEEQAGRAPCPRP